MSKATSPDIILQFSMVSMPCLLTKIQRCSTIAATMAKMFYFLDWYKWHDNLPFIKNTYFCWVLVWTTLWLFTLTLGECFPILTSIYLFSGGSTQAPRLQIGWWIYEYMIYHQLINQNMCLNIRWAYRLEYRGLVLQKDYSKNGSPHWSGFKLRKFSHFH